MSGIIHAVAADHVFDGSAVRDHAAVLIDGDKIVAVASRGELPKSVPVHQLPPGAWLAPGFIDIQVNGGGDVLFNTEPNAQGLRTIVAAHRRFGTTALLPTLVSDDAEKMPAALAAVDAAMATEPGLLGIHLEGPFLSPQKAGVHDKRALRRPTADDLATITAQRRGVTLVTLAPEQVPEDFVGRLTNAGIRVALGHSMATYAQTRAAMAQGLTGFTHLFNAMRPLESREPGPIATALESETAWYGLIVDGVHVAAPMLRLALRGVGRPILVSDAMPPVGGKASLFTLYGEQISVRDGRCVRQDGTLAGAYLDMASAVRNCVLLLDVSLTDALQFASTFPAQCLGLGGSLGRLAPGYRADMVAFEGATIKVFETWVAGAGSGVPAPSVRFAQP